MGRGLETTKKEERGKQKMRMEVEAEGNGSEDESAFERTRTGITDDCLYNVTTSGSMAGILR